MRSDEPPREELPFFVYGTLRPGAYNHDRFLLGRTAAEEEAVLPGAVLHDGPGYPYVVPGAGRVTGALLTAAPGAYGELLALLDRVELPAGYERTAREVLRTRDGAAVRAWVYEAAPEARPGPVIASGDWFNRVPDGPRTP
ncbi:gamma-glutamylcyclotransferase family protein [Streptomyces sp. NPDC126499]|uniref:gamma-glutamylcyclotransferase family protein n=1 Tax=Streptomyces sp. NPDC126499 TaxID=3155314 RepID=UPI003317B5FD